MNTVNDYLKSGAIDIAPLLSLALNKTTTELYTQGGYQLSTEETKQLENLIKQRERGVPFSYLSGTKGFYHLDFKVTSDTLIPRPETELIIDIALDLLDKQKSYDIVDLGTGSGIIAVTLADKCPKWNLTATDYSYAALEVAKTNATTNINFQQGRWFDATPNQCFDLIISNPPYIEQGDPYLYDLTYEPQSALVSGKDGLDDIRIIVNNAPKYLNQDGYLLLEHGYNQQDIIEEFLNNQFHNIQRFKDFNGQDRAILAQIK